MIVQGNTAQMVYVILRCNRWGVYFRWLSNSNSGFTSDPRPKHLSSWWWKLVIVRNVQNQGAPQIRGVSPVDADEAAETGRCINALPDHLRDTIIEEYLVCGTSEQKAASLAITPRAFRARREQAHVALLGLFNDAAAGLSLSSPEQTRGRKPIQRETA